MIDFIEVRSVYNYRGKIESRKTMVNVLEILRVIDNGDLPAKIVFRNGQNIDTVETYKQILEKL